MGNLLSCCSTHSKFNTKQPKPHISPRFSPLKTPNPNTTSGSEGNGDSSNGTRDKVESFLLSGVEELQFGHFKQTVPKKKVRFNPNVETFEVSPYCSGDEENEEGEKRDEEVPSYPPDHRYWNCSSEEPAEEEMDGIYELEEGSSLDDVCYDVESSGSLFSLQMDRDWQSFQEVSSAKVRCSSPDHHSCKLSDAVLKPVGNLAQWKEAKAPTRHLHQENARQSSKSNVLGDLDHTSVQLKEKENASKANWFLMRSRDSSTAESFEFFKGCSKSNFSFTANDRESSCYTEVDDIKLISNRRLPLCRVFPHT